VAAASGACVDDTAGRVQTKLGEANRVYLQTWPCNASDHAQIWHWGGVGHHQLINSYTTNACINDPASAKTPGSTATRLVAYNCKASDGKGGNAQWLQVANTASSASSSSSSSSSGTVGKSVATKSTPTASATAALQLSLVNAAGYHMCLDDFNGSTANNNRVDVYQCNGSGAQTWTYKTTGRAGSSGTFTITGKCLEANKNGTANGTPIGIYACNGRAVSTDRSNSGRWDSGFLKQ
jgi:hypothetical protein